MVINKTFMVSGKENLRLIVKREDRDKGLIRILREK